jgi:hypothetical protein
MSRCQHCNKLTHSEDLFVYVDVKDHDKIDELVRDIDWVPAYLYPNHEIPYEFGYLKKCDIKIRFLVMCSEQIEKLK